MDVIVTQTINRTRRFRVNDAASNEDAVRKVMTLEEGAELPTGITLEEEGGTENGSYSTQAAPKRPA